MTMMLSEDPPPCNSGIIGIYETLIYSLLFLIVTITGWGVHVNDATRISFHCPGTCFLELSSQNLESGNGSKWLFLQNTSPAIPTV